MRRFSIALIVVAVVVFGVVPAVSRTHAAQDATPVVGS